MEFSAEMIAGLVQGTVVGDPKAMVNDFAKIEEGRPGCISFLANDKYEHYIYETESSVVLVSNNFEPKKEVKATLIKVPDAREAVAQLLQAYEQMKPRRTGVSELAFIDPTARIGKDCYIGPFVAIAEGVEVGDGCVLHPHVTIGRGAKVGDNTEIYSNAVIYHDCKVGSRCILHAGCVIGADGFGFQPTEKGYDKIPQIGIAIIEDDVEIGANTCVDRAVMGATVVHSGVKLDNLVQIAHNDEIGSHTVMSAQVGVAGSTKIGEWCMFGGQVGIAGHATIANRTMAGAQSGIPNNVKKEGQAIQGSPAIDGRLFWKASAVFKQLPDMWADMNRMKKEIEELKKKL
ncbi:MAG: UDP-3-O-(3-hydroxymyristoyl)glucosamine N-acyltransferase [Prevotellaceae bacterium]|nr:UDP-3-O-(3-hydroxymyristoyl)glucosamine N-acyltransferase [Prevotellaceae bacterium]MDY6098931.1 UDP-3-O-(3-hydroxymyristoyl)glucosamine N-acyltransferase [Bacteroidaceae bacterium]